MFTFPKGVMNYTYTLHTRNEGAWGSLKDDGISWTGLVGRLQRKEIDIG